MIFAYVCVYKHAFYVYMCMYMSDKLLKTKRKNNTEQITQNKQTKNSGYMPCQGV